MTAHRESPGFSLGVDVNVCEPSAAAAELPVGGEVSDHLWQHVAEGQPQGQPMLLVREGRPAADLWREGAMQAIEGRWLGAFAVLHGLRRGAKLSRPRDNWQEKF